ncbi:MAG: glycosyltransferase family 2 protein [Dehalococcoidia bacterium]|nr:glycosyltransferase family 2 protein [Dehalococcoidia bacterium]
MTSVDIVLPVLNEEKDLPVSLDKLYAFLQANMGAYHWRIVVADNGSTDGTLEIAKRYKAKYPGKIDYNHLPERGRGRALKKAWIESNADIVSFMDIDLSTRLESFPPMIHAIDKEGYDIAIGSRLTKGSRVTRGLKREFISRCYNLLIRMTFFTSFRDAQCGFKAMNRRVVNELIPLVKDTTWFLDTELLIIAAKNGYRIKEIPVTWVDDPDTRVRIVRTVRTDIEGLMRLRFRGIPKPVDSTMSKEGISQKS